MFIAGVVIFALAILVSIAWHECGHMWVAQLTGMRVRRYFIGFGPKLWSTYKNGTEYGFKALPLGGFCDIAGMYAIDDVAPEDESRAMYRQKVWKRVAVLFAGPAMNFILAFIAIVVMGIFAGLPDMHHLIVDSTICSPVRQISPVQLSKCSAKSPAQLAGIKSGDMITGVNGQENLSRVQVQRALSTAQGPVFLTIVRGSEVLHLHSNIQRVQRFVFDPRTQNFKKDSRGNYIEQSESAIGVRIGFKRKVTLTQVIPASIEFTAELGKQTWFSLLSMPRKVGALWHALLGRQRDLNTPTSFYGAARIGGTLADEGQWYAFVMMLVSLNFFLGLFNLLPLLPLDGGHITVAVYEKLRDILRKFRGLSPGAPIDFTKLAPITFVFIVIGGLYMLLVLSTDIVNPINIR